MFQLTCDCSICIQATQGCAWTQSALTQLAYTTLSEHTYSLVANNLNLFIMKATRISCVTMNYPSKGSMLIEFTDGSSLMIPKGTDSEVIKLAFGITGRFIQAKEMLNL